MNSEQDFPNCEFLELYQMLLYLLVFTLQLYYLDISSLDCIQHRSLNPGPGVDDRGEPFAEHGAIGIKVNDRSLPLSERDPNRRARRL